MNLYRAKGDSVYLLNDKIPADVLAKMMNKDRGDIKRLIEEACDKDALIVELFAGLELEKKARSIAEELVDFELATELEDRYRKHL